MGKRRFVRVTGADMSAAIADTQRRLNMLREVVPKLIVDGVGGAETQRALRQFQQAHDLPVSDWLDVQSASLLMRLTTEREGVAA